MIPWTGREPTAEQANKWRKAGEAARPDGALVRRWTRGQYDFERQLVDTEDRYEVIMDGNVVRTELHRYSPALRWYSQQQAVKQYEEAGFANLVLYSEFTAEPAAPDDRIWTIAGHRAG